MTAVPVLLYHGIGEAPDLWTVSNRRFTEDVQAVLDSGRTIITVADYVNRLRRRSPLDDLAVISFDDGEESQLPAAVELAEAGLPCTVYVTSSYLGRPGMLTVEGLRELGQVPGIEVGSHSMDHLHLDVLRREQLRRQVRDSKARLEDLLGRPVDGIAYPHGAHDRRVLAEATDAGYTSGAGVKNALSHEDDVPMAVARATITDRTEASEVRALLRGEGRLGERRPRLRTQGYRVVRRARHALGV
ncbi:MAG: glycosyl transferase, family 2 [Frankiales bacterium]|nr:glycosyl transferase, family 2 [Frankiales bacterium]